MPSPEIRSGLKVAFSPFLNRGRLSKAAAVNQMADDLRVLSANAGSITADDMELLGWTAAQLALHGLAARRRALARSERSAA
jgi:type II secretory pathway component PulM